MIRKYSLYFANIAAIFVFAAGIMKGISFSSLVLRTVITFFGCYYLGIILGVITIESLLDSQMRKVQDKKKQKIREENKKDQG